jgi:hypothetical protein
MTTYHQALQRTDGRWDFTSSTGSTKPHPLGYCAGWKEPPMGEESKRLEGQFGDGFVKRLTADIEAKRQHQAKYHSDGHATEREACDCFRQYELDNELEFRTMPKEQAETLHKCQAPECGEFTAGLASLGQYRHFYLCDAHRNRDVVEALASKRGA